MKKEWLFLGIFCFVVIGIFLLCSPRKSQESTDAIKFKEEYESLNGKVNESNGKAYRKISISEQNPFIYQTADQIADRIENGETFVVYFGFAKCPWCRSVLPTLSSLAQKLSISEIYYVDVYEIRDVITLNDDGTFETTKEGTKGYQRLLTLLDGVLSDYTLKNAKGETINVSEKRIYAPNVVSVLEGTPEQLVTGISSLQTDTYMELTEEMLRDTEEQFQTVFQTLLKEEGSTCSVDTPC